LKICSSPPTQIAILPLAAPLGPPLTGEENTEGPGRLGDPGERGLKYCPSTRYADPV
jgi:hypothetical protein